MCPRLFWFVVGAGAATWWSKHHQQRWHRDGGSGFYSRHIEASGTAGANPSLNATSGTQQWDADRARLQEVGRQVGDTVTDLSEASLDMLLTTVQSMKEKLAQHRMDRERFEAEQRQRFEAQRSGIASPSSPNAEPPRHLI
ncbi:hypothetical protein PQX77_008096 [Marasmius sp. AFHP31]|nr:hypothetical protein PQX77_008096 [Marasmius sp. AFHP31]